MVASTYTDALKQVLVYEGGYVNHPADPGGATNKGVTQATYNAYRKSKGLTSQSVKLISEVEIQAIYRSLYWDVVHGDDLPAGVDFAVFDFAVNSGPSRAAKFLQAIAGVDQDGQIGPKTIAAVRTNTMRPATIAANLCDNRLAWLKRLSTWSTFGKGWSSRVESVRKLAIKWADAATVSITPSPAPQAPTPSPPVSAPTAPAETPKAGFWSVLWAIIKALF